MPELPPLAVLPALPEIIVVTGAMALLLVGAFSGERSTRMVSWLAVAVLILALIVSQLGGGERRLAFYGMFVTEAFALFMKALVLIGSAVTILLAMHYNEDQRIARFEFPVLVLLSTAGMMVMISANDLITLYVGLELQNLPSTSLPASIEIRCARVRLGLNTSCSARCRPECCSTAPR